MHTGLDLLGVALGRVFALCAASFVLGALTLSFFVC